MSTPFMPNEPTKAQLKQMTFDALHQLRDTTEQAANNSSNSDAQRLVALDLCDEIDDQLEALDEAQIGNDVVELQGAASGLSTGITALTTLKNQISSVANGMQEATSIMNGIDKAVGTMQALGA